MKQTINARRRGYPAVGSRRKSVHRLAALGAVGVSGLCALAITVMPLLNQVANAMTITSISQSSGSMAGGDEITIKGSGFARTDQIRQVVRSGGAMAILTDDGRVYVKGLDTQVDGPSENKVCINDGSTYEGCYYPNDYVDMTDKFNGESIKKLSWSAGALFALSDSGHVFVWGDNGSGVFGDGTTSQGQTTPLDITGNLGNVTVTNLITGQNSIFAYTSDGDIYAWGGQAYGQLGVPGNNRRPQSLLKTLHGNGTLATDESVQLIIAGLNNILITNKNRVLAAGNNDHGQIGDKQSPFKYTDITNKFNGEQIIAGAQINGHAMYYLTKSGRVLAMGDKDYLGKPMATDQTTPVDITDQFAGQRIVSLTQNGLAMIARSDSGRVFAWGGNTVGSMFGLANVTTVATPIDVTDKLPGLDSFIAGDEVYRENLIYLDKSGAICGIGSNQGFAINGSPNNSPDDINIANNNAIDITPHVLLQQSLVKSVKVGDKDAVFAVVDGNTIRLTMPKTSQTGKVEITIVGIDGSETVLRNGYEYMPVIQTDSVGGNSVSAIPVAPNTGM